MAKVLARLMKDENCATAMEYALIAALIAIAIVAGAATLGSTIKAGAMIGTHHAGALGQGAGDQAR